MATHGSNDALIDDPNQFLDIPKIAQEEGFTGMIVGVWIPTSEVELQTAEKSGQYPIVVGYSVGNEGLDVRYKVENLITAMERLRKSTGKPVTTTEQIGDYYENSPLWEISDWIFPNAHPYFSGHRDPQKAAAWTAKVFGTLASVSDKPLIFQKSRLACLQAVMMM